MERYTTLPSSNEDDVATINRICVVQVDDDNKTVPPSEEDRMSPTSIVVNDWDDHDEEEDDKEADEKEEGRGIRTTRQLTQFTPMRTQQTTRDDDEKKDVPVSVSRTEWESLQSQVQDLRHGAAEAQVRRERMQDNIRHKRTHIQTLEKKLSEALVRLQQSREEAVMQHSALREGIVRLEAARDDFRGRWKAQIQVNKELHEQLAVERARWRREEQKRTLEAQLLEAFRKLSRLTGFHTFGKEIRMLETELAEMQEK